MDELQTASSLHRSMSPKERHHIFGDESVDKGIFLLIRTDKMNDGFSVPEYWLDKPRKTAHPEHDRHFLYNISYRGRDEVFRLQPHERLFGDGKKMSEGHFRETSLQHFT